MAPRKRMDLIPQRDPEDELRSRPHQKHHPAALHTDYLVRLLISRSDDSLGAEGSNVTRKVPRTGVAWGRVPADPSRTEDVRG